MTVYHRIKISRTGEVPVSAAEHWQVWRNWSVLLEWMPKESPPMPLLRTELQVGHSVTQLPCTRLVHVDRSKLPPGLDESIIPSELKETLLYADEEARFLYYTMHPPMPFGMRNYFAYTEIDDLGPDRARVTNTGRVDIPEGAPADAIAHLLSDTYTRGIIDGIGAYALAARGKKP